MSRVSVYVCLFTISVRNQFTFMVSLPDTFFYLYVVKLCNYFLQRAVSLFWNSLVQHEVGLEMGIEMCVCVFAHKL